MMETRNNIHQFSIPDGMHRSVEKSKNLYICIPLGMHRSVEKNAYHHQPSIPLGMHPKI